MGRASTTLGRARRLAAAIVMAALGARVLTLPLAANDGSLELGLVAAAALWLLAMATPPASTWRRRDAAVLLDAAVLAGLGAAIVYGARQHFGDVEAPAVLGFATIAAAAAAASRLRTVVAATVVVESALALSWLLWSGAGVPPLLIALAVVAALQLMVTAEVLAGRRGAASASLRTVTHAATAERVGTAIDVLGVTRAVLEHGRASYPVTSEAFVFLHDAGADRLRPLPLYLGPDGVVTLEADNLDFTLAPHEGLAGKVFAASRPMMWPTAFDVEMAQANLGEQARRQLLALRRGVVLSAVGAPLLVDDEVIGVYLLTSRRQELAWCEEDLTAVGALAAEAARAIERARRYERELDQAHLDSITGLANHRQLTRTLDQELARARRRETSLGVLFCDLDRFKAVNDTYGHAAGDRVLTILARVFHELLRREDSAARYGGDEFVCVLPGADRAEADAVGRRIADSFAARVREDPELRLAGVSISCGVGIFPDDADGVEALLNHADEAMRAVKAAHRTSVLGGR